MADQSHLFGWCSPDDQYHNLCLVQYTTQFGVTRTCGCLNHKTEGSE